MLHELKMYMYGIARPIYRKSYEFIMKSTYRKIYKLKNERTSVYIPVLAFHWFASDEEKNSGKFKNNRWYASIKKFENQLKWLKNHNYYTLTGNQFYEWISEKSELTGKPVLLTFDDGELSQLNLVAPLLNKYGYHGICFVIGKHFIDDVTATVPADAAEDTIIYFNRNQFDESKQASSALELGSHTYNLHYLLGKKPAACVISDEDMRLDISRMQQFPFDFVAMPYGGYGKNTESLLSMQYKLGFAIDRVGNPYASRKSDLFMINRIVVDGEAGDNYLDNYLY